MPNTSVILRCRACRTLNRVPGDKLADRPHCGQCKAQLDVPHAPLNVNAESYDREVNDWPEILLAEFWAKWCGYCRAMEPYLNNLATRRAGRLKVIRVDVDSEQPLARRFMIKATPTFILYRNGRQLGRMDGAPQQQGELENWIDRTVLQSANQK